MHIIADLQLHSKYSRAVSPKMDLFGISEWALKKGIHLIATGDWTHPLYFKEITANLTETSPGIYKLKNQQKSVKFLLSTEISSIYTQGGKQRRVHNLIFSPSIQICERIIQELKKRGANLMSDGRPIVGISSKDLLELCLGIDKNILFIPAHCLPPYELIETSKGLKKIEDITTKDSVLTHTGNYRKVKEVLKRKTEEILYKIIPWYYTEGIQTTGEHPFLAIKTIKKCPSTGDTCIPFGQHLKHCYNHLYKNYKKEWIPAKNLELNDFICFPIINTTVDKKYENIGTQKILIDDRFCLLIGYFLSEGCVDKKGGITFTFSEKESDYVSEVIKLMQFVFNIYHHRIYRRNNAKSIELIFYSKDIAKFLAENFYIDEKKHAPYKIIPEWILYLPKEKQKHLIIGWFRGDAGYTSSVNLASSVNKLLLRMGIIPYISKNNKDRFNKGFHSYKNRVIKANYDNYQIKMSFINDICNMSSYPEFKRFKTKIKRRHGFMDNNFAYLPVRKILKTPYDGQVYNLEVKVDHSYTTPVATVHNCWTPWFSIFGSKSGFDSIEECFGNLAPYIYAIETGLSSDPLMNWQIKELDNRSIVSFSDAHSGPKLGRESTVFVSTMKQLNNETMNFTYHDIAEAIKQNQNGKLKIGYTIEFFPEEGKYHWDGHRACGIRYTPQETKEKGIICPKCKQPLTIGVEWQVNKLASRTITHNDLLFLQNKVGLTFVYDKEKKRVPFVSMIPLLEILLEINNHSQTKAMNEYERLITLFATEFDILLKKTYEEIESAGGKKLRDAIRIVRERKAVVDPGFDGVFGTVKIFNNHEEEKPPEKKEQLGLF